MGQSPECPLGHILLVSGVTVLQWHPAQVHLSLFNFLPCAQEGLGLWGLQCLCFLQICGKHLHAATSVWAWPCLCLPEHVVK